MPISKYLRKTTRRQHLTWVEWLRTQMNVPSRSDWYLLRMHHSQLSEEGRPDLKDMAVLFEDPEEAKRREAAEPFPRFTKESAAKARADVAKAQLKIRGVKVRETRGS